MFLSLPLKSGHTDTNRNTKQHLDETVANSFDGRLIDAMVAAADVVTRRSMASKRTALIGPNAIALAS